MVIFDQLSISDDGKLMYIDMHVSNAGYFENVWLDELVIMTADKVSETDPKMPTSEYIYKKVFEGNQKEASLVLDASDFLKTWEDDPQAMKFPASDMSKTLFFVYAKVKGAPDICTPCELDKEITVGVTFDSNVLHQKVMQFTRELAQDCQIPQEFTDFILLWNAFKSAVETEHFVPAINYWNQLFSNVGSTPGMITKNCGCHG